MKGTHTKYTPAQFAWIKRHRKLPRCDLHRLFLKTFRRRDVTVDNIKALCTRKGWLTGRTGRYAPGAVPSNKGKKMPFNPNSARTQFKKGRPPHNTTFAGHERICKKDGYVYISINETNPHTGFERRDVLKHKYLWEKKHGPVPAGECLKSLDGNKANTDPGNWVPVPRSMLPRLAGRWGTHYDTAPGELKPTLFAIAKLESKARAIRKGKEQ